MALKPEELLIKIIKHIPQIKKREWDGKICILEMRDAHCNNWKQTEWVGFYLEFLTENTNLPGVAQFRMFVGNTCFNGCAGKNIIDYKTSSSDEDILLNDQKAMEHIVNKYNELGYIIIKGDVEKERGREMDIWRKNLTGKSKYVLDGEISGRRHRKLKIKFYPKKILYISINKKNINQLKRFDQGVNSDGKPRNPKYILPKKLLSNFVKAELDLTKYKDYTDKSVGHIL